MTTEGFSREEAIYSHSPGNPGDSGAVWLVLAVVLLVAGCQPPPPAPRESQPVPLGARFDEKETGTIRGRAIWSGVEPKVEPIHVVVANPNSPGDHPNPNAPAIDPKSRGVAGVLVFLRAVDPERSRSWNHEPVTVAFEESRLDVRQGKRPVRIGIVRRGEEISCVSREKRPHLLELRGEVDFSLPLAVPDKVATRKLERGGIFELASGSALYWLRGHLWTGEHPYAALTDAEGRFELGQVPAGDYQVVCWLPNWRVVRRERHPESGDVERLIFEPGVEQTKATAVRPGVATNVDFEWRETSFAARK